jgi:hypothetical protein
MNKIYVPYKSKYISVVPKSLDEQEMAEQKTKYHATSHGFFPSQEPKLSTGNYSGLATWFQGGFEPCRLF